MINVAELLKDVPEDFELYSPLFGKVKFKFVNNGKFGIVVEDSEECRRSFDKYGRYFTIYSNAECLLFPSKDCRTWEGWKLPIEPKFKVGDWIHQHRVGIFKIIEICESWYEVIDKFDRHYSISFEEEKNCTLWTITDAKDGDVLATNNIICVFKKLDKDGYYIISPCIYTVKDGLEIINDEDDSIGSCGFKPATKEDRDLLFRKMKEAGYEWDADKKELLKIKHYAIANFHAGMPVLVRDSDEHKWLYTIFGIYNIDNSVYPFVVVTMRGYAQCIPFEGNEHLLGTTDMCPEEYINW